MNNNSRNKPTSPHIQIYRWNISSITSIMHRLTGVALYFSLLIVAWFIVYYTYSIDSFLEEESCECALTLILKSVFFGAVVFLTFALYYHFCNGIRHLFWDIGKGLELKTAKKTGYLSFLIALILTVLTVSVTIYLKLF